jgi:hypothetical protein
MSQVTFNIGNEKYTWRNDKNEWISNFHKESLEKFIINMFIAYCAGEE